MAILGASILALAGCHAEPTTVTGLVTLDGRPLTMKDGMRGTVVFQPAVSSGRTLTGNIDSSGRYELAAGSSTFVTPSIYWVAISVVEIIPPSEGRSEPTGRRVTPGRYASATDSGFRIEVVPGPNEVDLPMTSEPAIDAAPTEELDSSSDEAETQPPTDNHEANQ